jgi:CheY-like chemotaxis protein
MNQPIRIKILVVEDDTILRMHFITALMSGINNVDVTDASCAEIAIEKAKSFEPDIIFMDIDLGKGKNGMEAAEEIRSFSKTPIIFATSMPEVISNEFVQKISPSGVVAKPVNHKILRPVVHMVLANKE